MTVLPFRRRLPMTRGHCVDGPRPCIHTTCSHSLLTVVHANTRHQAPAESCALDVADRGEHTLEEVGTAMGLTTERVRQVEISALKKLARSAAARRLERE